MCKVKVTADRVSAVTTSGAGMHVGSGLEDAGRSKQAHLRPSREWVDTSLVSDGSRVTCSVLSRSPGAVPRLEAVTSTHRVRRHSHKPHNPAVFYS